VPGAQERMALAFGRAENVQSRALEDALAVSCRPAVRA